MPLIDTHTPGTLCWVDVAVETGEQQDRLMSFFSELFGWTWDVNDDEAMSYYCIAQLEGAAVMGLGRGAGGEGRTVTYFATADMSASVARSRELGADVFLGPMSVPGVGQWALVRDPVGAVHGLWQAAGFAGFARRWEPGSVGWFDHVSADPSRAGRYYADLTGHEFREESDELRVLVAGGDMFASLSIDRMPGRDPQWNVVWVTDSLERVRATATRLGGAVLLHEMEVPGTTITVVTEPVMHQSITIMAAGPPGQ